MRDGPLAGLFGPKEMATLVEANEVLQAQHYLGPSGRGFAYMDDLGVLVFANPSSRRLPQRRWLELVRWCIRRDVGANAGSRQWSRVAPWLKAHFQSVTTVVSYSDPAQGHTGALYRACNWLWAPTWHRLRPPPSGNGKWSKDGKTEGVKDRWIWVIRNDEHREEILSVDDPTALSRFPFASYREPTIKRGRVVGGGGDFKRWVAAATEAA